MDERHARVQESRQQPAASRSSRRGSRKQYDPKAAHSAAGAAAASKRVPPITRTRGAAADRNASIRRSTEPSSCSPSAPCSTARQRGHTPPPTSR